MVETTNNTSAAVKALITEVSQDQDTISSAVKALDGIFAMLQSAQVSGDSDAISQAIDSLSKSRQALAQAIVQDTPAAGKTTSPVPGGPAPVTDPPAPTGTAA